MLIVDFGGRHGFNSQGVIHNTTGSRRFVTTHTTSTNLLTPANIHVGHAVLQHLNIPPTGPWSLDTLSAATERTTFHEESLLFDINEFCPICASHNDDPEVPSATCRTARTVTLSHS
jgi:hypothetical protein